ncbi:MAG: hypothetical protein LBH86_05615 [Oscillospiraceae bacterium]|jgi:hypothetical protein|nr:hypothetical protein [Oscillospiraceae bacterium]
MSRRRPAAKARRGQLQLPRTAALLAAVAALAGCDGRQALPYTRRLCDYALVRVVGVDAGETDGRVTVTFSGRAGSSDDEPPVLTWTADTLARAMQEAQARETRHLFLGHTEYYLFGEAAARAGLGAHFDFLVRAPDTHCGAALYLAEDATARALLTDTGGADPADALTSMEADRFLSSPAVVPSLSEAAGRLAARAPLLVPLLRAAPSPSGAVGPVFAGYAVLLDGRLLAKLSFEDSWAVNLLAAGRRAPDTLEFPAPDGGTAALRLRSHTVRRHIRRHRDGRIAALRLDVTLESERFAPRAVSDAAPGAETPALLQAQNAWVTQRLEAAVARAQALGVDYLGLGTDDVRLMMYKAQLGTRDWDAVFASLPVEIRVRTVVN